MYLKFSQFKVDINIINVIKIFATFMRWSNWDKLRTSELLSCWIKLAETLKSLKDPNWLHSWIPVVLGQRKRSHLEVHLRSHPVRQAVGTSLKKRQFVSFLLGWFLDYRQLVDRHWLCPETDRGLIVNFNAINQLFRKSIHVNSGICTRELPCLKFLKVSFRIKALLSS